MLVPNKRGRAPILLACVVLIAAGARTARSDDDKGEPPERDLDVAARAGIVEFTFEMGPKALDKRSYQLAVWLADGEGRFLDTVYVTKRLGQDGLGNGYQKVLGKTIREHPETAPVWAHARGIRLGKSLFPSKRDPLPNAVTGATPKQKSFVKRRAFKKVPKKLQCFAEIKIAFDKTPSIVFGGKLDTSRTEPILLEYLGTGDPKGKSGRITHKAEIKSPPSNYLRSIKVIFRRDGE